MTLTREAQLRLLPAAGVTPVAAGEDMTVEMSFASEAPYERFWGTEILECKAGTVRLDRLNDGGALLYNHDWNALRGHHVPGTVRCDPDGVLRGSVSISWDTDEGRTIRMVERNHLTKTSVGYEIHGVIEEATDKAGKPIKRTISGAMFGRIVERCQRDTPGDVTAFRRALDAKAGVFDRADGPPATYRVIDWEPMENSLVTVPADPNVGKNRTHDAAHGAEKPTEDTEQEPKPMTTETQEKPEAPAQNTEKPAPRQPDAAAIGRAAMEAERTRIADIEGLADLHPQSGVNDLVRSAKQAGDSVEKFQGELLRHLAKSATQWNPDIGMSRGETKQFSIVRAIGAMISGDWSDAGLEREATRSAADKAQRAGVQRQGSAKSFFLPSEVQKRVLVTTSAPSAGNLVGTELRPQDFIDLLYARTLLRQLGATPLTGLIGNADIPKLAGGATAYWLATETTDITASDITTGLVELRPKNLGALGTISRQMMMQSTPDVDAVVMRDLAAQLGVAIDKAGFAGTGAGGQPTGIIGTSGVGSVTGTALDWAAVLEFQSDVANANALNGGCSYVTTPSVAALLATRARFASTDTPLWSGNLLDGNLGGFSAHTSTNLPAATMLFGDFSQVFLAEWGVLEIDVNPYHNFAAGIVGIRAFQTVDVGVRMAAAFSAAATIT